MSGFTVGKVSMRDIATGKLPEILRSKLSPELIESAKTGNVGTIRRLLKMPGLDVNAVDSYGDTALIHAAGNGRVEVVKELLGNEKVDVNAVDIHGDTALIRAARSGRVEVVKLILDKLGLEGIEITG